MGEHMSNPYSSFCEDFYINMRLGSQLNLPHQRETLLHFFERIQKEFPSMTRFRKSENGEFNLEEDRSNQNYRWVTLDLAASAPGTSTRRKAMMPSSSIACLLELAPFHLGVSPVEIDYLDVLFGFDLCSVETTMKSLPKSLLADSPLNCLSEEVRGQGRGRAAFRNGCAERGLPAPGPHRHRHPHQQLSGPDRRLFR